MASFRDAKVGLTAEQRHTWEATFAAFAMAGPWKQLAREKISLGSDYFVFNDESVTYAMSDASVLAILRSLLTSWVILSAPANDAELVDVAFICSERLAAQLKRDPRAKWLPFSSEQTEEVLPNQRSEAHAAIKNQYCGGIGDVLGFLLSSITADAYSPSLDSEEFSAIAFEASFDLLDGHAKRSAFQGWLENKDISSRTLRDLTSVDATFLVEYLAHNADRFGYWSRWVGALLNGKFVNWELAQRVALLPHEVWEAGADAVSEAIAEIEAEFAFGDAKIGETLVLDERLRKYAAKAPEVSNETRLMRHLARVQDALEDIIALGGGNGLTENTVEYLIITRLLRKYPDDPERVAFDLTDVNKSIRRQVEVGEYADDPPLLQLVAANTACVSFICESEPEIAKELARDHAPPKVALKEAEILLLKEAWQLSEDMLVPEAAQTTVEDKAEILTGQVIEADREPFPDVSAIIQKARATRSIVLRRQISRLWQQARGLMTVDGLAKEYDRPYSKALGYVGRVGWGASAGAGLFWAAIRILGTLLGLG